MKRIGLFIGGFLLIYIVSVIVINLPQQPQQPKEVVNVKAPNASPSAQVELPSVMPNL